MIETCSDADVAHAISLKSMSGNMLMIYGNCVFWRSKRQDIMAGYTTASELVRMSAASYALMWLKKL